MKTWIVIAAYNEGQVIRSVIEGVRLTYPDIVVVDDASQDNTAAEARAAGAVVVRHLLNRGQGAALKTGIVYALQEGAEAIVTFDADGQHDPKDIPAMLKPIEEGRADVALGSRFLDASTTIPTLRRAILTCGVWFTRMMSHIRVTDTHNGLRVFTRQAAQSICIIQDRYTHASEILDEIVRHRLRYMEVPVTIRYTEYSRKKGQSNFDMFKIAMRFILHKLQQ